MRTLSKTSTSENHFRQHTDDNYETEANGRRTSHTALRLGAARLHCKDESPSEAQSAPFGCLQVLAATNVPKSPPTSAEEDVEPRPVPLGAAACGLADAELVAVREKRGDWGRSRAEDALPPFADRVFVAPSRICILKRTVRAPCGVCLPTPDGCNVPLRSVGKFQVPREHLRASCLECIATAGVLVASCLPKPPFPPLLESPGLQQQRWPACPRLMFSQRQHAFSRRKSHPQQSPLKLLYALQHAGLVECAVISSAPRGLPARPQIPR